MPVEHRDTSGAGATSQLLLFLAADPAASGEGTRIEPIEISLVAGDPRDGSRMDMKAPGPEGRVAALRGADPRVASGKPDELPARLDGQTE